MSSTPAQRSLSGGELAPALQARCDTVKYATGVRTMRNFFIKKSGGVSNRPGTEFIGEVKTSSKNVRLVPMTFPTDADWVMELGDEYARFILDGEYFSDLTLTITGVTNANPGVVTYTGTDPSNGDEVHISGIVGAIGTYLNGRNFKIANVNGVANTFELQTMASANYNTTALGAYTSAGTAKRIYTMVAPYDYTHLSAIKYAQTFSRIVFTHPSYAQDSIDLGSLTTSPPAAFVGTTGGVQGDQGPPTGVAASGAAGTVSYYNVSAINQLTGEESVGSGNAGTTGTFPRTITWTDAANGTLYNIYRSVLGVSGLIGTTGAGLQTFTDTGITPDFDQTPPIQDFADIAGTADKRPAACTFYQQRLILAATNTKPETAWATRTGLLTNFTTNYPVADDSKITFSIKGRQSNKIKHLLGMNALIAFTTSGEWAVNGDANGVLTPTATFPKQQSFNGASDLQPLVIDETALYVQELGSIVRDLNFDYQIDGYRGNDLTTFAQHLFEGYELVDWAYQKNPNSIVWAVRDDGVLLGLTYVREHQIAGWFHCDVDGLVENVCCVREGSEDAVYIVVKRTIGSTTKRYVERLKSRTIDDIVDSVFMDCSMSFDGRNTGSTTMTLSGSGWTYQDTLTLTASAGFFTSADVGNRIDLTGSDGTVIRFTIDAYSSTTVVTGRPHMTVPLAMHAVATATWTRCVDDLTGLWHLEGKDVAVFADGFVVASPNNAAYDTLTVANGQIHLSRPYGVIHVGLPYISDLETLNIDTPSSETLANKKMLVNEVNIWVEDSRGIWTGSEPPSDDDTDPLEGLYEAKLREDEAYDEPVELKTGVIKEVLDSTWNSNGRIFIRQVDPVPLTVLAIAPSGAIPYRQGGG